MQHNPKNLEVLSERHLPLSEVDAEYAQFEIALEDLGQNPPGKSEVVRAFCSAAISDLHAESSFPEFRNTIDILISDRHDMETPEKAQLLWRAFQSIIFNSENHGQYPEEYTSSSAWQKTFRNIIIDKAGTANKEGWILDELLASKSVQSNEPLRYSAAKFALSVFAQFLPAAPSAIDSGTSVGYGPTQLVNNLPINGIRLINTDKGVREKFREALRHKQLFSNFVSMDLVPDTDAGWVEMCAYPEELANTKANAERMKYRELLLRLGASYRPVLGDLTAGLSGMTDVLTANGGAPAEVSMLLTTAYKIKVGLQDTAIKTAEQVATEDGLVIVADFATVNPDDKTKIWFPQRSVNDKKSKYNLLVKHKASDNPEYEHLLTYATGRCKEVYIEPRGVERLMEMKL